MMHTFDQIEAKILSWDALHQRVELWKASEQKIVFTNGCFDLIHYGHLHYLASARDLGDRLVMGLNSDASVKRLKGDHRPIKDQQTRQLVLAAFAFVDAVTIFEEDTPYDLIKLLLPDLLVKGGDWAPENIVGSDLVLNNGGTVKSLPYISGHSTTSIETKIKQTLDK